MRPFWLLAPKFAPEISAHGDVAELRLGGATTTERPARRRGGRRQHRQRLLLGFFGFFGVVSGVGVGVVAPVGPWAKAGVDRTPASQQPDSPNNCSARRMVTAYCPYAETMLACTALSAASDE